MKEGTGGWGWGEKGRKVGRKREGRKEGEGDKKKRRDEGLKEERRRGLGGEEDRV